MQRCGVCVAHGSGGVPLSSGTLPPWRILPYPVRGGRSRPRWGEGQLLLSHCTAALGCSAYPPIYPLLQLSVSPPVVVLLPLRVGPCTARVCGSFPGVEGR